MSLTQREIKNGMPIGIPFNNFNSEYLITLNFLTIYPSVLPTLQMQAPYFIFLLFTRDAAS